MLSYGRVEAEADPNLDLYHLIKLASRHPLWTQPRKVINVGSWRADDVQDHQCNNNVPRLTFTEYIQGPFASVAPRPALTVRSRASPRM